MKRMGVTYLRILLTTRCNMSCRFCHREGVSCDGVDIDKPLLLTTVGTMYDLGFRKFKLMGGEPSLYPNLTTTLAKLRKRIGDSDLSMISNGTADAIQYEKFLAAGMDRLNISIHGWTSEFFSANTLCSIDMYDKIRRTVVSLSEKRLIGKLNYVVRKGVNEHDFLELLDFAGEKELLVDALNLLDPGGDEVIDEHRYSMQDIERLVRSKYAVRDAFEVQNRCSLPSRILKLANGASVNLKVSKLNREMVFDACSKCTAKQSCVEGIKAVRLTPTGIIQPCLIRTDNVLDLNHSHADIAAYLMSL